MPQTSMKLFRSSAELKAGDWVRVRSKDEILATLDQEGCLEGLPFMPEMLEYCGQRVRVFKRAHKTCDTIHGTGGRRMYSAVHLDDLRCDGEAHGGCQARCLLFWKEAWLCPDDSIPKAAGSCDEKPLGSQLGHGCSPEDLGRAVLKSSDETAAEPTYTCQATKLYGATTDLRWYNFGQYIEDWRSGNATFWQIIRALVFAAYNGLINAGIGLGPVLRWFYDVWQLLWGGVPYPRRQGRVPQGKPTPDIELGLQVGDRVRVRSYAQILDTLDRQNRNRGLYFDAEEVLYCGGEYKVLSVVDRIINERTGRMMKFKKHSVLLKDVVCQARYSSGRCLCPRAIYSMWREAWLEKIDK